MTRVLHLETGMHLYGGARQVGYILEGLKERNIDNLLLCPAGSDIEKLAIKLGITVIPSAIQRGIGYGLFREIKKAIATHSPSLLHVHSRRLAADFWGGLAAKKSSLPALLSRRVDNPERHWLVRLKYRNYDKIIAISEGIRQVLISEGVASDQVITVRSTIDLKTVSTQCNRAEFLSEFGLEDNHFVIAVIAQLIYRKGHRHLIDILPEIVAQHPNIKVLFFGQGREEETLRAEINRNRLGSFVEFVGFREDLLRWLPCIDLVVHPADREGLGVSLIQAAAASRPMIAVRAGGMPEIVHDGVNGLLIEPGDVTLLREYLLRLIGNNDERLAFGKKGRDIVESEFSLEAMVDGNLRCYQQVLEQTTENAP